MNNQEIYALFENLLSNQCSHEEANLILDILSKAENKEVFNKVIESYLKRGYDKKELTPLTEMRLNSILEKIITDDSNNIRPISKNVKIRIFLAIAALVLITLTFSGLYHFRNKVEKSPATTLSVKVGAVVPGGNKAVLTLADGRKIILNDAKAGEIAKQSNVKIKKASNGLLVFQMVNDASATDKQLPDDRFNTITTPRGGQYQVILPDGTAVWLNSASSLKFPAQFNVNQRVVELSGEAYFEVSKRNLTLVNSNNIEKPVSHIPFIVVTNHQRIEVLGTKFNVTAYPDEPVVKTTLLKGLVKVSTDEKLMPGTTNKNERYTEFLHPGEQSELHNGSLKRSEGNIEAAIAWKNGKFQFENDNIETVMRKISRWYDIEIEYRGGMENKMFTGTISKFEDVTKVLRMLDLTGSVSFKITGRKVIVF